MVDTDKKAVEMENVVNEEKIKADLIEEILKKSFFRSPLKEVRRVMEERDLYDVKLIHKIISHDLNRV